MSRFETMGQLKEVKLAQGVIHYRESGEGKPLVFIHGLLVNGDLWRKVVPALAKSYRCIVPDLPLGSHQIALDPAADLTPPGVAQLIADFMAALNLTEVTLVGNDTGGALCQIVITQHPERIERLVLTNCDAFENFFPPLIAPFQWLARVPGLIFVTAKVLNLDIGSKLILSFVTKYAVDPAARQSFSQPAAISKEIRRDLTKFLLGVSNRYTKASASKFSSFDKPVLLVWAKGDSLFPEKYVQRLAQAFPNTRLESVQNSKAFVSEDQPASLINAIEKFVSSEAISTKKQR